jgi:hypothetical protein
MDGGCLTTPDADQQWERNKQNVRVREQNGINEINRTACHRAGDCSAIPITGAASQSTPITGRMPSSSKTPIFKTKDSNQGPGTVSGLCLDFKAGFLVWGGASLCLVWNGIEDVAVAGSIGGGQTTGPMGGLMGEGLTSNAKRTQDLAGPFAVSGASGSLEFLPISGGGEVFTSFPANGQEPVQGLNVGGGAYVPVPEVHTGGTFTGVLPIPVKKAWDWFVDVLPGG